MDAPYKIGAAVKQKVVAIQGEVVDLEFDKSAGSFRYLVSYQNEDGVHSRWFSHDEIAEEDAK